MIIQINVAEAKAKLSALIEAAERGEEVVIARAGNPVARLTPIAAKSKRRFGLLKDYGWTGDPTPAEAFDPDPEDAVDRPLWPSEPSASRC